LNFSNAHLDDLFIPFIDSFFFSGEFNDLGIAEGKLDSELIGAVSSVRLVIKTSSKNWVIISEIMFNAAN